MTESLRLLYRAGDARAGALGEQELSELYRHPQTAAGYLRINVVATMDGAAAGPDRRSGTINTGADRAVFALLRSLADVILVGAGTVRAEGYRAVDLDAAQRARRERLGLAPFPTLAVISNSLDLDPAIGRPRDGAGGPVVIITSADHDHDRFTAAGIEVWHRDADDLAAEAVSSLRVAGSTRILCEGGARLTAQLLAAGLVDDLCLTLAPTMIGGDMARIVTGDLLGKGLGLRLEHLIRADDDTVITRWTPRGQVRVGS